MGSGFGIEENFPGDKSNGFGLGRVAPARPRSARPSCAGDGDRHALPVAAGCPGGGRGQTHRGRSPLVSGPELFQDRLELDQAGAGARRPDGSDSAWTLGTAGICYEFCQSTKQEGLGQKSPTWDSSRIGFSRKQGGQDTQEYLKP